MVRTSHQRYDALAMGGVVKEKGSDRCGQTDCVMILLGFGSKEL